MKVLMFKSKLYTDLIKYYIQKHNNIYNVIMPQAKSYFTSTTSVKKYVSLIFIWPISTSKHKLTDKNKENKIPSIIESADHVFEKGLYKECYNLLINYEAQDDVELKWRICRVLYNMAKDQTYDDKFRKSLILQAFKIISEEQEKHWNNFQVQKWYALVLDAKSSNEGTKDKIEQLENIKKHMDIAVSLNPNDASLMHVLGEWCYQVTELPWHQRITAEAIYATIPHSTYEEALEYFLKAESVQPRFYSINLLRIGCCYLKLNKHDQAKYYLKLAASYPAKSDDDHHANKVATELLKKLKQ